MNVLKILSWINKSLQLLFLTSNTNNQTVILFGLAVKWQEIFTQTVVFGPLFFFRWKKTDSHALIFFFSFWGKVKYWCYCLFGELEARETGIWLDVVLALTFVLYSSSRSGGLASGVIWLCSTLRTYWCCLAVKHSICWGCSKGTGNI